MSQVRRRVLRPPREPAVDPRQAARLERLRQKLDRERVTLGRWMSDRGAWFLFRRLAVARANSPRPWATRPDVRRLRST